MVTDRIERVLFDSGWVQSAPNDVRSSICSDRVVSIMYGETFDDGGTPVETLKYCFFVSDLSDAFRTEGYDANARILIADSAVLRNAQDRMLPGLERALGERYSILTRARDTYGLALEIELMSSYIGDESFLLLRDDLARIVTADADLMRMLESTVPTGHLARERRNGFLYSFDELASIIDVEVKVGPPREDVYDSLARRVNSARGRSNPLSVFLHPTYPLGVGWSWFFTNPIEEEGITAYKARSRGLEDHRIIVNRTSPDKVSDLVARSFIPRSDQSHLPNPVLDLAVIGERARSLIEGTNRDSRMYEQFQNGQLTAHDLRDHAVELIERYVMEPMRDGTE